MVSSSARIGSGSPLRPYYRAKIRTTTRAGLRAAPRSDLHPETRATSYSDLRVERWTGLRAGVWAVLRSDPCAELWTEFRVDSWVDPWTGLWTNGWSPQPAADRQECYGPADRPAHLVVEEFDLERACERDLAGHSSYWAADRTEQHNRWPIDLRTDLCAKLRPDSRAELRASARTLSGGVK